MAIIAILFNIGDGDDNGAKLKKFIDSVNYHIGYKKTAPMKSLFICEFDGRIDVLGENLSMEIDIENDGLIIINLSSNEYIYVGKIAAPDDLVELMRLR